MRAILANQAGGPDVLSLVEQPDPEPGPGQLLVRTAAAGVNFRDIYERSGVYPMPFPHVPGAEGAGTVLVVGDGVSGFAVGARVAWADARGSYDGVVVGRAEHGLPGP